MYVIMNKLYHVVHHVTVLRESTALPTCFYHETCTQLLELNAGRRRLATVTHTRSQQCEVVVILNLNTRTDNIEDTRIDQERIRTGG